MRSRLCLALLCALPCAVARLAVASAPDRFGFGMRSPAMAGTGAASASDYEATYSNPAGLAAPSGGAVRNLSLGFVVGRYRVSLDGARRTVDDTNGLLIGATLPIPLLGGLRDRLAIGFGFYLPVGVLNRARATYPDQAMLPLLESNTQTVSVMVAAAARPTRWLSFGGGVLVLASLSGAIRLRVDNAGRVTSQSEQQLVADYAPIVGLRIDPLPWLRLGAVLRGRSESRYDIRVDSNLTGAVPIELPAIRIAGASQFDPLQVAVEGAFSPRPSWLLVAQIQYKRWSDFARPAENATLGTAPLPPHDFHDTVVPRLAVEYTRAVGPTVLALRGGYFFEWSPAPDAAPSRNLLDASIHAFSVGAGLGLKNRHLPLRLDLFFQWRQLQANPRVSGFAGAGGLALGAEL